MREVACPGARIRPVWRQKGGVPASLAHRRLRTGSFAHSESNISAHAAVDRCASGAVPRMTCEGDRSRDDGDSGGSLRHRRRHQRLRHRAGRGGTRAVGRSRREGRSGAGNFLGLDQALPWRPALSRVLRIPAGPRGAGGARDAARRHAAHQLADALRAALERGDACRERHPGRRASSGPSCRGRAAGGRPG